MFLRVPVPAHTGCHGYRAIKQLLLLLLLLSLLSSLLVVVVVVCRYCCFIQHAFLTTRSRLLTVNSFHFILDMLAISIIFVLLPLSVFHLINVAHTEL